MKKKAQAVNGQARRATRRRAQLKTWAAVIVFGGLAVWGVSQMSGVAYDENAIKAVNFSILNESQKDDALEAANRARCTCGCGMTLAQCVSTDMTCPIRESNIDRIKTMVREAQQPES